MIVKLIILLKILNILIKPCSSNPSIITSTIIDLLENSPINTLVIDLTDISNNSNVTKLHLLNINGFETKYFLIKDGKIHTKNLIDREEFIDKKYCLSKFYCKIELQILVNNGLAYWIIPIHIIE